MTIRLYHEDAYLKEFECTVTEAFRAGDQPAVILDRTAFYATSGGQPCDTGRLGEARVVNVAEQPSGKIVHFLNSALPLGPATGTIDWERRFDHMQQHTGQHILSQAFVRAAEAPTISFHMGRETSTIDLDLPHPSDQLMEEAEALASTIIFEDRPVHLLKANRQELETLGARKHSEREGEIRIIDVERFDRSPCGGTHVRRTGEIGLVGILGYERYKGGTRVEFVCGGRALKTLRKDREILKQMGRLYSAHLHDLPRLAEKLLEDRSVLVRENSRLEEELLALEAGDLLRDGARLGGFTLVRKTFSGRSLESLKLLAQKIVARGEAVALLGLVQETAQVVVARSAGIPLDCGAAVKKITGAHGGKGGGKPELAQAGAIPEEALENWLRAMEGYFAQ